MDPQNQTPGMSPNQNRGGMATTHGGAGAAVLGGLSGNTFIVPPDIIERILTNYKAVPVYMDDFSRKLDLQGWREQYDSSTPGRVGLTLTDEARAGSAALLLHTRPAASDEAWMRKGLVVPTGVTKVIKWAQFMFHAANANNPSSINFDFDYQTASGTNRHYFRYRYLIHDGTTLLEKWQANTGTPTSQSFTDITGGGMTVPWNESEKPMLCYMVAVFDVLNNKYEALYANGLAIDVSAQNIGPTAGASLSNFDKGAVDINCVINRSNSSEDALVMIEKPGLAFVY